MIKVRQYGLLCTLPEAQSSLRACRIASHYSTVFKHIQSCLALSFILLLSYPLFCWVFLVVTTRDVQRCRLPIKIVSVSYFYLSLLYLTKTKTVAVNHFHHRRMTSHLICSPSCTPYSAVVLLCMRTCSIL